MEILIGKKGLFGGRFAMFEATFVVGLQARPEDLMAPLPLPPAIFCAHK